MDYENYIELYEAVYLFNRLNPNVEVILQLEDSEQLQTVGISPCIYLALLRILVVNDVISYNENAFTMTEANKIEYLALLAIIEKDPYKQYPELFEKAIKPSYFFFDHLSDAEYEIYARCNFPYTYGLGREITKHLDLTNQNILELGGNSGGLATAVLLNDASCQYTLVDSKIPCEVGRAYSQEHEVNIHFLECDIFRMTLEAKSYDTIILMNLLHDFDDETCRKLLKECMPYCHPGTQMIVIEDILTSSFTPKAAIMHGLRLSVECRGGKQRCAADFSALFTDFNFELAEDRELSEVNRMLIFSPCDVT